MRKADRDPSVAPSVGLQVLTAAGIGSKIASGESYRIGIADCKVLDPRRIDLFGDQRSSDIVDTLAGQR